ncbi:unnamed protein product [Anisakis simplex]|uniref:Nuclear body protein SP140-like protein n=1 Tax=Anisakis simplex TaxID=6269 RepID=A0A0M3JS90_ANISI|nr:unnamed protein product [Anisakis simplex]
MPVCNGKLWIKRSNGSGNSMYVINWTGESFKDEGEMKKRIKEYNEKKWMCRHMARDVKLFPLKEALRLERNALDEIRKGIPRDLLVEICNIVHHCFSTKESLIKKIRSRLDGYFFKDELVSFTHLDREYKGTIRKRIDAEEANVNNDQENEPKYAIEINGDRKVMIKNVESTSIKREYVLSDQQLDDLVSLISFKKDAHNAPWIVDDQFRESFNIPDKIHSLFTSSKVVHPTAQIKPCTNEAASHSGFGVDVENVDGVRRKRVKQPDEQKSAAGKPKRKKSVNADRRSTSNSTHQQSLTNFLVTTSSPVKTPASITQSAINSRKVEATMQKLLNALINNDVKSFTTCTQIAAKSLSLNSIQSIDNDIIRFAITKQFHSLVDHNAMKKMSNNEKKLYKERMRNERKDEHSKMEKKLHWLLNKKIEDTLIDHKRSLPIYDRIELATEHNQQQFMDCLELSEFLNCFKVMLRPDCLPSADDLLNALYNGREGFFEVIAHILIAFLKLLFNDETGSRYKGCGMRLGAIAVTFGTVSEMTRLVLNGNENRMRTEGEQSACSDQQSSLMIQQQHEHISTVGDKLGEKAFFELDADEQLDVLMFLENRILETNTLNSFLSETVTNELAKLENDKQSEGQKMACLEAETNELKVKLQSKDDNMTRQQSLLLTKLEKQYDENVKKMERITEKIQSITSKIQQLMITRENAHRVKELGSDRFHQHYWFYEESPNCGIFIEGNAADVSVVATADSNSQQNDTTTPKKTRKRAKIKTIDAFINHQLTYLLFQLPSFEHFIYHCTRIIHNDYRYDDEAVQKEWFLIRDENGLKQLMQSLSRNGYRESNLYSNIQSKYDQILSSFTRLLKTKKSGECEQMNEQELICDEIKTFYDQLCKSSLSTNCDEAHSSDMQSIRDWLLRIEDSLCTRAFVSFDRSQWRIHKCSSCNRQRNRDDLIICKQCSQAIHMHCIRPVITTKPPDGQFVCQSCNQSNKAEEESEVESDGVEGEDEDEATFDQPESSDTEYLSESDYERPSKKKKKKRGKVAFARNRTEYKYFDTYTMVSADRRSWISTNKLKFSFDAIYIQMKHFIYFFKELEEVFSKLENDIRIYNALITVPAAGRSKDITLENIKKQLYSAGREQLAASIEKRRVANVDEFDCDRGTEQSI